METVLSSCCVCALGRLKMMKKKNIAISANFNLADSRIYCLRGCLHTLNIPADILALQEYSETHEKPYKFIVCEFRSSLEAFRVCASPYATSPSLHRESTDSLIVSLISSFQIHITIYQTANTIRYYRHLYGCHSPLILKISFVLLKVQRFIISN